MEGPFSLARSFLKVGAKNIFFTLFKIDSRLGAKLMVKIVKNLRKGKSYAAALQRVKKQWIKTYHPCAWSAPIFIGSQSDQARLF